MDELLNIINGTLNNDQLVGTVSNDSLRGQGGNDTLSGGDGNDVLDGGAGSDTLTGGIGTDFFILTAGEGVTTITDYEDTRDKLVLGVGVNLNEDPAAAPTPAGRFTVTQQGADTLISLVRPDGTGTIADPIALLQGVQASLIDINAATTNDFVAPIFEFSGTQPAGPLEVSAATRFSNEVLRDTFDYVDGNGLLAASEPQNFASTLISGVVVNGSAANDVLTATVPDSLLQGGAGDDRLDGSAAGDNLAGGLGNDLLIGNDGADDMIGGEGNDTLDGGNGNDRMSGNSGRDILRGGAGNDEMEGGDDADRLLGQRGNDVIFGDRARDQLRGGAGNDWLVGGAGADTLVGNGGRDFLLGGTGRDSLTGGGNRDFFGLSSGRGVSIITDYTDGRDQIALFDFATNGETLETFEFESLDIIQRGQNTVIESDGDRLAVLQGVDAEQITANDFTSRIRSALVLTA